MAATAVGSAFFIVVLGIVPWPVFFSGVGNSIIFLFISMFIVNAACINTGFCRTVGSTIVSVTGRNEKLLTLCVMVPAIVLSSVASNTGTTACLMPITIGIAMASGISPARLLMPLAFAAGLGGVVTLVGTVPNIIVSSTLKRAGFLPFGFFEFAQIGLPMAIAGVTYMMLVGRKLLPAGVKSTEIFDEEEENPDTLRMFICAFVLLMIITMMLLNLYQIKLEWVAAIGAGICIVTGCIKPNEILKSIDWSAIALLIWSVPLAIALDESDVDQLLIEFFVSAVGRWQAELFIVTLLFLIACGLSQFMSNHASAALLSPIGLSVAERLGANPHAVLLVIAVGASCAFATPIGSPPNMFVLNRGGYRFVDFIKCGFGMVLVCLLVILLVVPLFWPIFYR